MIIAILGEQGSGKTLFQSFLLLCHKLDNAVIMTNYSFRYTDIRLGSDDLESDGKLLNEAGKINSLMDIGIDELHLWLDSRRTKSNTSKTKVITQMRKTLKERGDFYYTTQSFDQVELRVRTNTSYAFFCQKIYEDGAEIIEITPLISRFNNLVDIGMKFYINMGELIKLNLFDPYEVIDE